MFCVCDVRGCHINRLGTGVCAAPFCKTPRVRTHVILFLSYLSNTCEFKLCNAKPIIYSKRVVRRNTSCSLLMMMMMTLLPYCTYYYHRACTVIRWFVRCNTKHPSRCVLQYVLCMLYRTYARTNIRTTLGDTFLSLLPSRICPADCVQRLIYVSQLIVFFALVQ